MSDEAGLRLLRELHADRWFAHRHLFAHRHPDESAPAHKELVAAINRPVARLSVEGFRRFGKTTYLEETALLKAVFREFHNMVIVGPSLPRACDRIAAIQNEIKINPYFCVPQAEGGLFGVTLTTDSVAKIVLSNGVCIQALGRDQSMTGMKYLAWRPDAFLVDDVEDPEEKRTDAEREDTWRWLMQTFLPSMDDVLRTWGRFLGTRRGKLSLPERLETAGMMSVKFPIESLGEKGERVPTWPSIYPLDKIDQVQLLYRGDLSLYAQEYMCQAVSAADRRFDRSMFKVEPRERTYEAVYAFVDPARAGERGKANATAATGWAVWSWVRNRLIVWASGAEFIAPDDIVALIFDIAERFDPVWVFAELDGLAQWLMQPIRQEQVRRGVTIPVKGIQAMSGTRGGGQTRFIEGLQPLFVAHEVIFAQPMKALEDQLLSFPHGIRDTANALAYAQTTRPGALIYDGFSEDHIVEQPLVAPGHTLSLAANATGAMTAALLVSQAEGVLRILADWVFEGPPAERVADIAVAATLAADTARWRPVGAGREWDAALKAVAPDRMLLRRESLGWVVAPKHSDRYTNVGLMQAIRHLPAEVRVGGAEHAGALHIRDALGRTSRGGPAVEVGANARWTLRALAGGYARPMVRGRVQEEAEAGPYRVLMEALESFCGLVSTRREADENDGNNQMMRVDERTGARYASAMPQKANSTARNR